MQKTNIVGDILFVGQCMLFPNYFPIKPIYGSRFTPTKKAGWGYGHAKGGGGGTKCFEVVLICDRTDT